MVNEELGLWDKAIEGLKSMDCKTNAFDMTDYKEL